MSRRVPPSLCAVLVVAGLLLGGCPPISGVSGRYSIIVSSMSRSFRLFVPSTYTPGQPMPLVIALHGFNMNGGLLALYSGLEEFAEQEGFVVAFPNGALTMWQSVPGGHTIYNTDALRFLLGGFDDVTFVSALIDRLSQAMSIDETRVYVCGISNGGMMSYLTAIELSDRVAAVASIAAPMPKEYTRVPHPDHPVPILIMHGTDDPILPYAGGRAQTSGALLGFMSSNDWIDLSVLDFLSVDQTVAYWIVANNTDTQTRVEHLPNTRFDDGATAVRRSYRGGDGGSEVVLYSIVGGGHTWPGAAVNIPAISEGNTCYDLSANEVMWEFFQRFRRE